MQIITGRTGENHVTSDDDRALYAGIFGTGSYVLNTNQKLAASIISSNTIRISNGDLVHQGTHARIRYNTYEDVTIDNGTTGYKRIDLIVARYTKSAGLEAMELAVIKGTPSADPAVPEYTAGNILQGASLSEMPLYQITLDGVNIESVTALYTLIGVPMSDVMGETEYVPIIGGLGQQLRDFSTYVSNTYLRKPKSFQVTLPGDNTTQSVTVEVEDFTIDSIVIGVQNGATRYYNGDVTGDASLYIKRISYGPEENHHVGVLFSSTTETAETFTVYYI